MSAAADMDVTSSVIEHVATPELMHGTPGPPAPTADGDDSDTNTTTSRATVEAVGPVVVRIESILESVVDSLAACQELSITLSRRTRQGRSSESHLEHVHFPGRTVQEARKFARVLLLLQLSHDALVSGTILTKRHIFYQHQDLFEKQRQVDDLVDDLALTFGVTRGDLNIVAASKGVLAGQMVVELRDGSCLDPTVGNLGIPIPHAKSISKVYVYNLKWILVVEKDAIFRSLCSSQFWRTSSCGPGAIITAKGYPDLTTRSFLNLVHSTKPQLPILGLVDFDPDGINILRCYRYGSQKLAHEAYVCTPAIIWLGIKSRQLMDTHGPEDASQSSDSASSQVRLGSELAFTTTRSSVSSTSCQNPITYLSLRDRRVAESTLKVLRNSSPDDMEVAELRRELQVMLHLGTKAEIEWLDDSGDLCQWLNREICLGFS
ncbi:Spo11/DNA topoisomerase VI subunit A [Dactylonectria estremocensis]|uniref:DNA topoisomerase (ATP-hydrolyzing) n=1 Tax=Dactylonectria estremocensis TaxID=1079267 RepID=A0A9P9F4I7_9HYPO|nr:Spo11/DNA topoisomerase VI subunit A [Dactylonectria estremocensis]